MSKDQKTVSEKIVENVDIIESLLMNYKTLLENSTIYNSETKEKNKMIDIFPFNLLYNVCKHILKGSELNLVINKYGNNN